MRRLVGWLWVVPVVAVGLLPAASEAFGRRGGCREDCGPVYCAPYMPPAAPEVRYEDRKITYLKPVWKDQVIEEVVVRCVPREEKFVYDVKVPVWRDETRIVKVNKPVMREEKYPAKVAYPVHGVEKRNVVVNVPVWKDVEYTYTVNVAKHRPVKRTVPFCTYETKFIETTVPVCRVVRDLCTDECGRCYTVCRTIVEHQKVTRCVRVPVHGTREVVVNECYYEPVLHKGVRRVCHYERKDTVVEVPTCRTEYKDVIHSRMVCHWEAVDQEMTYRVCDWRTDKREGVRCVYDRVEDKIKRTVRVCHHETVTETIRVPVGGECYTSYHGCDDCGRGGLFGRRRCR
jgi:hypothetical protein